MRLGTSKTLKGAYKKESSRIDLTAVKNRGDGFPQYIKKSATHAAPYSLKYIPAPGSKTWPRINV